MTWERSGNMCDFSFKDPTGGLFDLNRDGKLDAAEYTLMNHVIFGDDTEDNAEADAFTEESDDPIDDVDGSDDTESDDE